MPVSVKTQKIIWGQCSARCCLCRKIVIHAASGEVTSLVGEVAHIVGERKNAARGQSELSIKERNEPENLLLLYREHHKIVDDDAATYPVEKLQQIKLDHIEWISDCLAKQEPWKLSLSQLTYINVPRLCEQAELQGYRVDLSAYRESRTLHSLGWELNRVMSAFKRVLPNLSINAVPLPLLALHEGHIGTPIAFDLQRFRTKNILSDLQSETTNSNCFTGDLAKDPHIYAQLGDFRLVFFIDQQWITTTTAFTLFRPSGGQSTFSGLGRVTGVDYEARVMTATPWVIGLSETPFDQAIQGKECLSSVPSNQKPSLDSMVDLDRAKSDSKYYVSPPDVCDLCNTIFNQEKYLIDGELKESDACAIMCANCFSTRGKEIRWGSGQLYLSDEKGWLLVAGFPTECLIDDDYT